MRKFCYSPGECVHCGSDRILYSDPIIDEKLIYPYECEDCHTKGQEIYDIDFSINKEA